MRYMSTLAMYGKKMMTTATAFVSMEIFNIASGQGYLPAKVSEDGKIIQEEKFNSITVV